MNIPQAIFHDSYQEFVALLLLAAAIGAAALRLRQPLTVAFIALGILVGPSGLRLVSETAQVHLLAELGLALLLFLVGLRLDVGLVRSMGKVAVATGLGEVLLATIGGYAICIALGLPPLASLYVSVALAFSSTIIIIKLLSDKRDLESLHGRIAVGFLIVQDVIVIATMIGLTGFMGVDRDSLLPHVLVVLGKGMALVAGLWLMMRLVLPRFLAELARNAELLVLFGIAWAVGVAGISEALGFSKEVGAFLAGLTLASTSYREMLGARLASLRDFLLLFFFVDLGLRLNVASLGGQVWAAIPLSLFVLIGNPLIVMAIMAVMGYRKRTGFLLGLCIGQISEFSLILAALGQRLGHIQEDTVGLITMVGMITITVSTYLIIYAQKLFDLAKPYLGIFERKAAHAEDDLDASSIGADVILYGLGRYGKGIANDLISHGKTVLAVDFDPQAVKDWNAQGGVAVFGDAEDQEFPASLPLEQARWVISSTADKPTNLALISALNAHDYKGTVAVTTHDPSEAEILKASGADTVFLPFRDASTHAAEILESSDEQQRRKRMDKIISGMKDHYIVCGYGRMGQQIVKDFRHYEVPYVVVENNPVQLPKLVQGEIPHVKGKASEDQVLIEAGVKRAKGLIAVAASDEENVFVVLTARGMNSNLFIVARSILEENEGKLKRAGADRVMSPYTLGGHRIAAAVLKPRAMDFLDLVVHLHHVDVEVSDIGVCSSAPFLNKAIKQSGIREKSGVLILAVKRPSGEIISNPAPDTVLMDGDELVVLGTSSQIDTAEKMTSGCEIPLRDK